jgi:hypothetical protein
MKTKSATTKLPRGLSRFSYKRGHAFHGYRVQLTRHHWTFRIYISELVHGTDAETVAGGLRTLLAAELATPANWKGKNPTKKLIQHLDRIGFSVTLSAPSPR